MVVTGVFMKKFMFFVSILVFCFGSLAFLAMTGAGRDGILKSYASQMMHR
jgi:hypothetical protein